MNATNAKLSLSIQLLPASAALPAGTRLSVPGDLAAVVVADENSLRLAVRLADRPIAELRWLFEGLMRRVRAAFPAAPHVKLDVAAGVPDDAAKAIALDLQGRDGHTVDHALGPKVADLAASQGLYRRWVNEDPTIRTSTAIAADITAWVEAKKNTLPVSVDVFDHAACEALGLRLLCAVGGASKSSPPTLVIARYTPPGSALKPWMLLGKGITFDTGGINVKPYESFVSMMKNDMAGAALAFALFKHLAESGHPRPLICVIPTCENAVGEDAMRPGALVKAHNGLTVRIDHTDAEGRLVLADAVSYATSIHPCERVLCFATLTTAALIAYGPYATPVHFAPPGFQAALEAASEATGEDMHFFPERIWHREANRDPEADLRNTAGLPGHAGRSAGSRNAAHFLLNFTDVPLTHFDIFASGWNWAGDAPGTAYGATGVPLHTLIRALS